MTPEHHFAIVLNWTGNRGSGTSGYRAYGRDHLLSAEGKPDIAGSSDRIFHGDAERWNPEELLISALSQCHLLSYLHVAARHGILVTAYSDQASGTLLQDASGGGRFTTVTLHPRVTIRGTAGGHDAELMARAQALHAEAASMCFIGASVNFPVRHESVVVLENARGAS